MDDEMWTLRTMEQISCTQKIRNKQVLKKGGRCIIMET